MRQKIFTLDSSLNCFYNEIFAMKTSEILQKAFKDDCLSKTTVLHRYKNFKDDSVPVVYDGCPLMIQIIRSENRCSVNVV